MKTYKVIREIVKGIDTIIEKNTLKSDLTLDEAKAYLSDIKKRAQGKNVIDGVYQSGRTVQAHIGDKTFVFRIL